MYFNEFSPCIKLSEYINNYFYFQNTGAVVFTFPTDGCPGILINLGAPVYFSAKNNKTKIKCECVVFGLISNNFTISSQGNIELIAVKFKPWVVSDFFHVPHIELTDKVLPVYLLNTNIEKENIEKIYEKKSLADKIRALDNELIKFLNQEKIIRSKADLAMDIIIKSGVFCTIEGLSSNLALSKRHLERIFIKHVGITPKHFYRIARFNKLINYIKNVNKPDWAGIAYNTGFSDQSHLIREWKYFTGKSPQNYIRQITPVEAKIIGIEK